MSNEPGNEEPLKPTGKTGKVIAANPVESGAGVAWNNGAATYYGSPGKDMFQGSAQDDVFLSNGSTKNENPSAPDAEQEKFNGQSGHDVVVLSGFREDYKAVMPRPVDYPAASAPVWEKTDTLYGKVVALENIHTGESYLLNDVESVVFDHGDPLANPKQALKNMPERLESGAMTKVSTQELHLQAQADLSPAEQRGAKIAATRECAQEIARQYKMGMGAEAMVEMGNNVVAKLDQGGINVDERKLPEPDAPASTFTQRAFGPGMKP